jgi:Eco57I restriction-modification methylase/TaqI-like C-terminal specificity domain/N-6 DNA Methylase
MSASQLSLPLPPHRNQQLFSDYYLNTILPQREDWKHLAGQAAQAMTAIQAIYAAYTPSSNEAQTEEGWIRPVLKALGHTFEIQAALKTPDGTKIPDYVFYRDLDALNANKDKTLTDALPTQGMIAIGDAKYWDRPLDVTIKDKNKDLFNNKNPSYQIAFYIQHSGAEWGILTNGRLWRLFHTDTAHKLERYYEVSLPELLEHNDPATFLYFYAFFRRAAFDDHALGLRAILQASTDFARGISENLKQQVYAALRHIAQGFLDYPPNHLSPDAATLKTIYDNSLIVLYRLLFVFYAEARELLPLRESDQYRDSYSLEAITHEVAQRIDGGKMLLSSSALFWSRLRELFVIINAGSPPLQVATFNGGLFDPQHHSFLEEKRIGDAHLLQALDMLARVDKKYIDYRDLAERHLGTIYEGLLEYHLEPILSTDGWSVDLLNDKGERKATGSFYTPDYIVKYIVDQTVGPALRRVVAGVKNESAQVQAILAVNICDPAMGSGHFLVEATEYIARFLVDLGVAPALTPNPSPGGVGGEGRESDMAYWKRRVAQSCIYGVDLNPLAVDLSKLSLWLVTVAKNKPLSFLDHHLRCGNALIGARLDDLHMNGAAKANGHAKKAQSAVAAGQLMLLDDDTFRQSMSSAVDSMWMIEDKAANTVEEVKEQEQIYRDMRANLTRTYSRLANLTTAHHFGMSIPSDLRNALTDYATGRGIAAMRQIVELLDQADALATERRFFHWELEFPEVFFDKHGHPLGNGAGFDAVVGNPPYIRSLRLKESDVRAWAYYAATYQAAATREYDIYMCFVDKGMSLLTHTAYLGLIIPNKWLTTQVGESLRSIVAQKHALAHLVDFGSFQVFADVTTYTCLLFLTDASCKIASIAALLQANEQSHPLPGIQGVWEDRLLPTAQLSGAPWTIFFGATDALMQKLRPLAPLQDVAAVFKGTGTSADQVFFMQRKGQHYFSRSLNTWVEIEASLMRPALTGKDIDPYSYHTENYLLFPYRQASNEIELIPPQEMQAAYPHAWSYLTHPANRALLEGRDNGDFAQRPHWYGYGRPQNQHLLGQIKLVLPDVAGRAECAYDGEGRYIIDTAYGVQIRPGSLLTLPALATLLNSSLMTFFLQQTGTDLRGGYFRMKTAYLNPFPLPHITFTTPESARAALRDDGIALYATGRHGELLAFCTSCLTAEPEQSDVVHDLLAHLAEQMIDLHKQRQSALEDLTLDLEGVLAPGQLEQIGRLYTPPRPPKNDDKDFGAKQAKYAATLAAAQSQLGDMAASRLELRADIGAISETQWKWLLKERLKQKLGSMADLVKVYRTRQPAVAALDARIAATDRLIDQIVYALYGLTDEEIALVEG